MWWPPCGWKQLKKQADSKKHTSKVHPEPPNTPAIQPSKQPKIITVVPASEKKPPTDFFSRLPSALGSCIGQNFCLQDFVQLKQVNRWFYFACRAAQPQLFPSLFYKSDQASLLTRHNFEPKNISEYKVDPKEAPAALSNTLIVYFCDKVLFLWDANQPHAQLTLSHHKQPIRSALISHCRTKIFSGDSGSLYIWDVKTGVAREIWTGLIQGIYFIKELSEGQLLVGGKKGGIKVIRTDPQNLKEFQIRSLCSGRRSNITSIEILESDYILLATEGSVVELCNLKTSDFFLMPKKWALVTALKIIEKNCVIAGCGNGEAFILTPIPSRKGADASLKILQKFTIEGLNQPICAITTFSMRKSSGNIVLGYQDGTVAIVDRSTLQKLSVFKIGDKNPIRSLHAFDDRRLAIISDNECELTLCQLDREPQKQAVIEEEKTPEAMIPSGHALVLKQ